MQKQHYRTLWISDTHLGNRYTQAELLLEFLDSTESDYLFLLGDIIDLWKMSRKGHWPESHQLVLKKLFAKAESGTRVIYIPGNHDPFFRELCGQYLGRIKVHEEYMHMTQQGLRLLMLHGDRFDRDMSCSRPLFRIADHLYEGLIASNRYINTIRRILKRPYRSFSGPVKMKNQRVRSFIEEFEDKVTLYAREKNADGVICGHIHHPDLKRKNGVIYANDGDWLESCSVIAETQEGHLQLLTWQQQQLAGIPQTPVRKPALQP